MSRTVPFVTAVLVATMCLGMSFGAPILTSVHVPEQVVPASSAAPAPYAEWAHHHWVWLSHGGNGQNDMLQLAKDYATHNITVGAVDIDSTWETGFNNFIFDTTKYPNATHMVEKFHSMGIRVVLWITSFVDDDSPNYKEGYDNDYYLKSLIGREAKIKWWHGKGSLLDYTNPEAVEWWHKQMDNVLDMGIDGWKCDGTDPYINELGLAQGYNGTVYWHEYSRLYYGDFFDYTRKRLGDDRLIMSRPVDAFGPLFVRFSPKRVMLSGWVGDQDDTFEGLQGALKRYLQSAWDGYANFGSDIGGYRTPQSPRDHELFLRWAQLGAFSPLMENGGGGEHRPWAVNASLSTFVTDVYRNFVNVHYGLIPYFLSIGSEALDNGTSVLHPLAKHESFIDKVIDDFLPDTYDFLLGDRILVAPITKAGKNNKTTSKVLFPSGSTWTFYFDHDKNFTGNDKKVEFTCPLQQFPAFLKNGKLLPLNLTKNGVAPGVRAVKTARNAVTALIAGPTAGDDDKFTVRTHTSDLGRGQPLDLTYSFENDQTIRLSASAHQAFATTFVLLHTHTWMPAEGASTLSVTYRDSTSVQTEKAATIVDSMDMLDSTVHESTVAVFFDKEQRQLYIHASNLELGAELVLRM